MLGFELATLDRGSLVLNEKKNTFIIMINHPLVLAVPFNLNLLYGQSLIYVLQTFGNSRKLLSLSP